MAPADSPIEPEGRPTSFTGTDLFWILIAACLLMLLANGALFYFATDRESDFRNLIDYLC